MRAFSLALRFLLELTLLAGLAIAGARLADGAAGLLLAVGLPVIAAVIWGAFIAPKAARRLRDPARLVLEIVLFTAGAVALIAAGLAAAGIALGVVYGLNLGMLLGLGQRGEA